MEDHPHLQQLLKQFKKEVDATIEKGEKKEIAIMQTIQKYIVESKKVLFEGDGYSDEWEKEAAKRGLPNIKTTPLSLDAYKADKAKKLFEDNAIYNHLELEARHEIMLEAYVKKVQIEARVMGDLASTYIIPAAIKYQNTLLENIKGMKDTGLDASSYQTQLDIVKKVSEHINTITSNVTSMIEARKKANDIEDQRSKAIAYCDEVKGKHFDTIRYHADKLELMIDDSLWPLPKYRELLFLR